VDRRTRTITLSAALAALAVAFLWLGGWFPTGQAGFVAAASLFCAAAVVEGGARAGLAVFAVSGAVGALLLAGRPVLWLYVLFFGYYPIVKSAAERPRRAALRWLIKLTVFNLAFFAVRGVAAGVFPDLARWGLAGGALLAVTLAACDAAFVVYDIGLSRLIGFYIARISKNRGHGA
jgi:hypothetical protein